MNENVAMEPGEDLLRREFEALVGTVVDAVNHTAAGNVQQARGDMQKTADDLRRASQSLEQTARQARDAVTPVSDLAREIQGLNASFTQKAADLGRRLDQLQGQVNTALQPGRGHTEPDPGVGP